MNLGLYPMYAIELREYGEYMGIAIEDVQEIIGGGRAMKNEEEIDFSIEYENALVSEDELNGYSNSTFYQRQIIRLLVQKRKLQNQAYGFQWIQSRWFFSIMSFTMQWGLTFSL